MTLPERWVRRGDLRAIEVGDPHRAEAVVVLLHGFQMRPEDLAPFAHSLGVPAWFLFPEGPLPAQPQGRAWWHIDPAAREASMAQGPRDFAALHPEDLPAARSRLAAFLATLDDELRGRPLVVGGFSQGGMVTMDTIVRGICAVDGLVLMSTSRIAFDEWQPHLETGRVHGLPSLVTHGRADPDLALSAGTALMEALSAAGADVSWHPFEGGHEIPLVVWRALRRFLGRIMESA